MGRQKIHDHVTGERLLDAAEALLANSGPGGISARSVAQATGHPTRAIYSVFGDMDGLLAGLTARGYRLLGEKLQAIKISSDPRKDLIHVGLDGFRSFAMEKPHLYRITFEDIPPTALKHPAVKEATRDTYDLLMGFVIRAQEGNIGTDLAKSEFVISFHAVCQGLAGVELSHQEPPIGAGFWQPLANKDPTKIWKLAIEAFLDGLS